MSLPDHRFFLDDEIAAPWLRIVPLLSGRTLPAAARERDRGVAAEPDAEVRRVLKALARQHIVVEVASIVSSDAKRSRRSSSIVVEIAHAQKDGHFSAGSFGIGSTTAEKWPSRSSSISMDGA